MENEYKPLTWPVMYYDCNANRITQYDVLKHRECLIKELKRKSNTKDEFSKKLRREMMYYFWSKCEWELIVEMDNDNHVWLRPLVFYRDSDRTRVDVTDADGFDWKRFAEAYISKQVYEKKAKIDVFDQIEWRWTEFVDYCWHARLKYERRKFDV